MRCAKCNYDLDEHGKCPHCEAAVNVHVMSSEEREAYHGVTIEDAAAEEPKARSSYRQQNPYGKIYMKNIGLGSSSWLVKLSIFLVLAAIAVFVLFVALPVALIAGGIGIIIWLVLTFIRQ